MKRVFLIIWQLPQAILGVLVLLFAKKVNIDIEDDFVFVDIRNRWGLSLYPFIFVYYFASDGTWDHEIGHAKQSMYLGPLYLLVVGLPSFVRAAVWTFDKDRSRADYYKGWPENWADRLGGVRRD
jgi:hypothetical protein